MPRKVLIAIIGSGKDHQPAISNAGELGKLIAEKKWVLITGGRDAGVMKAANEGAKTAKDSLTIGILPDGMTPVSSAVDVAIVTDTGEARNNIIVLSADVVIACGIEGAGTTSEIALALKNGKQVILLCADHAAKAFFKRIAEGRIETAESPEEAVAIAGSLLSRRKTSKEL